MEIKNLKVKFDNFQTEIQYFHFRGSEKGQKLFICGGMHGNEPNGMKSARMILDYLIKNKIESKMKGEIYIFPLLNVSGFEHNIRNVALDKSDLNRSFNFKKENSFSKKLANSLEEIFKNCDIGIDLHDSGGTNALVPHTRIHIDDKENCIGCSRELAKIFGLEINLERLGNKHMLAVTLKQKYNIPVITVEIGGGKMLYPNFNLVINGLENVLTISGIFGNKFNTPKKQYFGSFRKNYTLEYPAIFELKANLGEMIEVGQVVGELYDPINYTTENIVNEIRGILFSKSTINQAKKGNSIFSILCNPDIN